MGTKFTDTAVATNLATDKLATETALGVKGHSTPASLSTYAATTILFEPNANHIINGDMEIWQRGTSFVSAADAAYTADRFRYGRTTSAVVDITRSTDVPTAAQALRLFNYSLKLNVTTADAAVASSDHVHFQYRMEGYDYRRLAGRATVMSFWVKSTKIGIFGVAFGNSGGDRTYIGEYTVLVTNTWELKTILVTASPSAGTWDYTTGVGIYIYFGLMGGSANYGTVGAWGTETFPFISPNQVNAVDAINNAWLITGIKFEPGTVATRSEPELYPVQLDKCMRYCEKSFAMATTPAQNAGVNTGESQWSEAIAAAAAQHSGEIPFQVRKRNSSYTLTLYSPGAASAQVYDVDGSLAATGTAAENKSEHGFGVTYTGNIGSLVGNRSGIHWVCSNEL